MKPNFDIRSFGSAMLEKASNKLEKAELEKNYPEGLREVRKDTFYSKDKKHLIRVFKKSGCLKIKKGTEFIEEYAFTDCSGMYLLFLPESLIMIENFAFKGCDGINHIELPPNVRYIFENSFTGMRSLKMIHCNNQYFRDLRGVLFTSDLNTLVRMPEGRTDEAYRIPSSVSKIANGAFAECKRIKRLVIPASVTEIDKNAFQNAVFDTIEYLGQSFDMLGEIPSDVPYFVTQLSENRKNHIEMDERFPDLPKISNRL